MFGMGYLDIGIDWLRDNKLCGRSTITDIIAAGSLVHVRAHHLSALFKLAVNPPKNADF